MKYFNNSDLFRIYDDYFIHRLPDIEEIKNCAKFMSDKIIDGKIEKFFKLKAFL